MTLPSVDPSASPGLTAYQAYLVARDAQLWDAGVSIGTALLVGLALVVLLLGIIAVSTSFRRAR